MVFLLIALPGHGSESTPACVLPSSIERARPVRVDCANRSAPTHYVLALTWSPQFCATAIGADADTRFQCRDNRFGFAVHGLWAQAKDARDKCDQPRHCGGGVVSDSLVRSHLCTMPGVQLIQAQWQKHGTCSGLSQRDWFATIDSLWDGLSLPDPRRMVGPGGTISVKELRDSVAARNRSKGVTSASVRVDSRDGKLEELRLCYTTGFRSMPCPQGTGISSGRLRVAR
ncbi:MAG TPA: hypothetical protein PKO15_18945 [Fibrobacteria bacterium]|nr:hypothetical protein [Fibrobacteria bacterium]